MKTTYCVKCKKDTDNIDPKIFRTKSNRLLMQSKSIFFKNKNSRFVKEQEAKGLLSNLGINTPFSKFLCWMYCFKCKEWVKLLINVY